MIRLSLLIAVVAGAALAVPVTGMAAKRPAKQLYVSLGDSYISQLVAGTLRARRM